MCSCFRQTLEKTKGATKNGQYRDTGNIGQPRMVNTETLETLGKQDTGRRETKQKQPQHRKLKR